MIKKKESKTKRKCPLALNKSLGKIITKINQGSSTLRIISSKLKNRLKSKA
jgi:hypothetical protein